MNKNKQAKLDMYDAVLNYCVVNSGIMATVPAFETAISNFKVITGQIHATAQLETNVITGIATDKAQMRESLCQQAANLAAVIYAYAVSSSNNELKAQVDFALSTLQRMKSNTIAATCSNILAAANANLAQLNTYGINAASLSKFSDAINDYLAKIAMPRNAVSQRAHYNSLLKDLFRQADDVLKNQADKLVNQFKADNPEFYEVYKNNRTIIDPGTSATQITGTVTDSASSMPLENCALQVVGQEIIASTNVTGNFILKTPVPGTVSVKITKAGYADKTITGIILKLGKTTTTDVQLTANKPQS